MSGDVSKRTGTIMYVFVREIYSLFSNLSEEDSIAIINKIFSTIENILIKNEVSFYKSFGSGIVAFFEEKGGKGESAYLAAKAALDINNGSSKFDHSMYEKYAKEVKYSFGLSYGECLIGNIGESDEGFALIGDPAHEALKLGREAPVESIFVTQGVYEFTKKNFKLNKMPEMLYIDKRVEQIPVFALVGNLDNEAVFSIQMDISKKPKYDFYILGCRGSYQINGKRFSEFGGETTCSIIKTGTHAVIIDCGTGFNMAGTNLVDCDTIDVLLSHVHYDHCIGLLNWSAFPEGVVINFYGDFDNWLGESTLNEMLRAPFWPVKYISGNMNNIEHGKEYDLGDDIKVTFYKANHPNSASLMSLDVGDKQICNMVDCEKADAMPIEVLKNADYLIYDGMYDDSEYGKHIGWGHSTWQEGCRLAKEAKVKKLIVSHHSPTATDYILKKREKEARKLFKNTTFARSAMHFKL